MYSQKKQKREQTRRGWKQYLHGEDDVVLAEQFSEDGEEVGAEEPRHMQFHVLHQPLVASGRG